MVNLNIIFVIIITKMPGKLEYKDVKTFIESQRDKLVSTEYINSKALLDIECKNCKQTYEQTFDRYKRGNRHQTCPGKYKNDGKMVDTEKYISHGISRKKSIEKTCIVCQKNFTIEPGCSRRVKICGIDCKNKFAQDRKESGYFKQIGKKGGIESVKKQERRSKNEISFANLCIEKFGRENVLCNQVLFNGWDADIILPEIRIAISWNGIWHYKQVRDRHDVSKVQSRDKLKNQSIIDANYTHYIIADMGKASTKFVLEQFTKFLDYLYFI